MPSRRRLPRPRFWSYPAVPPRSRGRAAKRAEALSPRAARRSRSRSPSSCRTAVRRTHQGCARNVRRCAALRLSTGSTREIPASTCPPLTVMRIVGAGRGRTYFGVRAIDAHAGAVGFLAACRSGRWLQPVPHRRQACRATVLRRMQRPARRRRARTRGAERAALLARGVPCSRPNSSMAVAASEDPAARIETRLDAGPQSDVGIIRSHRRRS